MSVVSEEILSDESEIRFWDRFCEAAFPELKSFSPRLRKLVYNSIHKKTTIEFIKSLNEEDVDAICRFPSRLQTLVFESNTHSRRLNFDFIKSLSMSTLEAFSRIPYCAILHAFEELNAQKKFDVPTMSFYKDYIHFISTNTYFLDCYEQRKAYRTEMNLVLSGEYSCQELEKMYIGSAPIKLFDKVRKSVSATSKVLSEERVGLEK